MDAPRDEEAPEDWAADEVRLRSGVTIPVRATSPRRRRWSELPEAVTAAIATAAGSTVELATSTGSGFTAGFASRLDLADGRRIFVKAASAADDRLHGWEISAAYRLEARNLRLLPPESGAVPLLWTITPHDGTDEWIVLGFPYVAGHPPRRPWRPEELRLTTERLADAAPALATAPPGLDLQPFDAATEAEFAEWTTRLHSRDGRTPWVEAVLTLAAESSERCRGTAVVHGDLRDDNVIVGDDGTVWICDWNWPVLGAPWLDLVTRGDRRPRRRSRHRRCARRPRPDPRRRPSFDRRLARRAVVLLHHPDGGRGAARVASPARPPGLVRRRVRGLADPAYGTVAGDRGDRASDSPVSARRTPRCPATLRDWVDQQLGSPVVETIPRTGGMSPAVAATVVGRDGSRAFVKAVSADINPDTPTHFRHEITVLSALDPAPYRANLLGSYDDEHWVAMMLEDVDGDHPDWDDREQIDAVFAAVTAQTAELTPHPAVTRDRAGRRTSWPSIRPCWRTRPSSSSAGCRHGCSRRTRT